MNYIMWPSLSCWLFSLTLVEILFGHQLCGIINGGLSTSVHVYGLHSTAPGILFGHFLLFQGDSGGPLVAEDINSEGYSAVGIVSSADMG